MERKNRETLVIALLLGTLAMLLMSIAVFIRYRSASGMAPILAMFNYANLDTLKFGLEALSSRMGSPWMHPNATGGIMALSCFKGRELRNFSDPEGKRFETFRMARKLVDRFEAEYGVNGGDCSAVQIRLMGRSFDIVRGEREAFLAAGGHSTACPGVCGKAAAWVIEILDVEGLL